MSDATGRRLKLAALVCLALPIVVLAAFAVGEVAAGTISGLQHVVQLLPLVALAWLGWKRPLWGGIALIGLTLVLAGLFISMDTVPPSAMLFASFLIFAPALLAGIALVTAGCSEHATRVRDRGGS